MKKPKNQREPAIVSLNLDCDEPYDTFKAQVLQKIDVSIHPKSLDFSHYTVLYNIPRIVSKPGIPISDEDSYSSMVERIHNITKLDTVNLHIESKAPAEESDKENDDNAEDEGASKKKKTTSKVCIYTDYYAGMRYLRVSNDKVPREAAILPGNIAKNKNIQDLREKWICTRPDSVCPSTHCLIQPTGEHLPLSHQHFDTWGSAMVSLSLIDFLTRRSTDPTCRLATTVEQL